MSIRKKKGFTLIELLVVIAIIGLLSTLAVVALSSARAKARDAKRVSDIKQIQSALGLYAAEKNGYPGVADALPLGGTNTKCLSSNGFAATCTGTSTFMGQVPAPPDGSTGKKYEYTSQKTNGTDGCAPVDAPCPKYKIGFELEANIGELKGTGGTGGVPLCTATQDGITCL
ncbi:MAG: type II secretion system protein [Candidatus Uhrbacteria bacterium]